MDQDTYMVGTFAAILSHNLSCANAVLLFAPLLQVGGSKTEANVNRSLLGQN